MAAAVGRRAEASEFIDFLEDLLRETGAGNIDIGEYGLDPTKAEEYAKNSYDVTQVLHDCDIYPMPLDECTEIISKSLIR